MPNQKLLLAAIMLFYISLQCCQKPQDSSNFLPKAPQINSPDNPLTVLPTRLLISPPNYIEEMETISGWNLTNGSLEVNTTNIKSGSASLKFNADSSGSVTIWKKGIDLNFSADSAKSQRIWVFPNSDILSTLQDINILYSNSEKWWTNYYKAYINANSILLPGHWNLISNLNWVKHGNIDWKSLKYVQINVVSCIGKVAQVSFDLLTNGSRFKPAILITFDDAQQSVYTIAYPLLRAKQMIATSYINSYTIDKDGKLTSAQLQELYKEGWSIANHTADHIDLTTLTESEIETELTRCKTFLDNLGLTRDSYHVAFPGGYFNNTVLAALANWGAKTGRNIINMPNACEPEMAYQIYARSVPFNETLATVKLLIDKAVSSKCVYVLVFHDLVDGEPSSGQWKSSDFSELLNYIASRGLQTLTIDEYYRLYTGSISVNHK
jgi:peptidoglycan/xylan/chitin deacetylase (PgdA/CDA1 family)